MLAPKCDTDCLPVRHRLELSHGKVDQMLNLRKGQEGVSLWSLLLECLPTGCEAKEKAKSLILTGEYGTSGASCGNAERQAAYRGRKA